MKSGRISSLVLLLLALAIGCAALVVLQIRSQHQAALAEMEVRRAAEEAQKAAAIRSPEPVEAPAISAEPLGQADARTPTLRADVDAKALEVLVLDPSNAPVADASLLLFHGQEVFAKGVTDEKGLAHFAAREGKGEYLLNATGWEPALGEFELAAGRRTVTLVEGAVVGGTVLIDGLAPSTPLELTWNPTDRKRGVFSLPAEVAKTLREAHGKLFVTAVRTHPDGTFMFRGLAADAAGTIQWTGPYFADPKADEYMGPRFTVPAPRSNLVIRLVAGLELRLRVVDVSGAGVPDAAVALEWGATTMTTNADSEGRLVQSFSPGSIEKIGIRVAASEGGGTQAYEFVPPPGLRGVWDVGDLAMGAARKLAVLVQDTERQPIADATVTSWPAQGARTKERTDSAGRIAIVIGAEDREIAAAAFGYLSARVAVPPDATEVTATLSRSSLLEFEIPGFTGDAQLLALELKGPTPLFGGEAGLESLTEKSLGEGAGSTTRPKESTFEPAAEKSGRWRIAGLTPNQQLHSTLKGGGKILSELEIPPLAEGERRRIELRLDEVGKSLRVRVVSPEGKPLANATVYVSAASENASRYQSLKVDAQGETELRSLFGDRCILFAHAKGFAAKSVTLQPIPTGKIDIALELPRTVEVELAQRDGSLYLEPARLSVRGGGPFSSRMAPMSGPGRYRLEGLPSCEVLLSASGSFGRLSQLLDPSVPFVRIVVGDPGSIQVNIRVTKEQSRSPWSVAIAAAGNGHDLTRDDLYFSDEGAAQKKFEGLAPGTYDVWLETISGGVGDVRSRAGQASSVVIDGEHPTASVELHPPS